MPISSGKHKIDNAVSCLLETRICWVVASWGMAGEDFLSCVEKELGDGKRTWYRLPTSGYSSQKDFEQLLDREFGCSIVDLCNLLSSKDDVVLLLDDAPCKNMQSGKSGVNEITNLAQTILDYCIHLRVVIRTTGLAEDCELKPIVLEQMDEADFNQYLIVHPQGSRVTESGMRPEELFNLSKGEPETIKKYLGLLKFVRPENLDFEESSAAEYKGPETSVAPASLVSLIQELKQSNSNRLYLLLECLSVFSNGEDISNIRNFRQDQPFFPKMAEALSDLGLIDVARFSFFKSENQVAPKVSVVKRLIQDYIKDNLTREELTSLNNNALALYFGRDWMLGRFKLNAEFNLDRANQTSFAFQNAATLIRRLVNDSLASGDNRAIQNSLSLLNFYISKLNNASQFRYICDTCHQLIKKLIEYGYSPAVQDIVFLYSKSLRMLGDSERASSINLDLLGSAHLEKKFKAKVLLDLAFCYEALNENSNALSAAKQILGIKDRSAYHYQAKAIIVSLGSAPDKLHQLRSIEKTCRNKGYTIAANNIALQIVSEYETEFRRKDLYKEIALLAKNGNDGYNFIKATVNYSKLVISQRENLSSKELLNLIMSYHYLCSQRMKTLFNKAHDCLWEEFEHRGDPSSLITLFKQSSLLFRLQSDDARERKYLTRLANIPSPQLQATLSMATESEKTYLVSRFVRLGYMSIKQGSEASQLKLLGTGKTSQNYV